MLSVEVNYDFKFFESDLQRFSVGISMNNFCKVYCKY